MMKRHASARRDRDEIGAGRRSGIRPLRRRRAVELGQAPGVEALEVRALLSGQTVQLIKDVNAVESFPSNLTPAGSNLFYTVEDSTNTGIELVATNAQGTQVLQDFGSSSSGYSYGSFSQPTAVGGSLFFLPQSGGSQLWTSDGTAAGTAQVTIPGVTSPTIESLASLGNTLVFITTNYTSSGSDDQLWSASPGGTSATMIEDFKTSSVSLVGTIGGTAYLSVGGNLWTTGGTANTTVEVEDSSNHAVAAPTDVFSYNGEVIYLSSTATSATFGILGSGGETPTVTGLPASTSDPVVAGSSFYFTSAVGATGAQTELWVSDGAQNGTAMLANFSPISTSSVPSNLVAAGGSLFFTIVDGDGLAQLWTSTGTAQGTSLVKDLGISNPYSSSYYGSSDVLVPIGGTLYFTAFDTTHGAELWSDNIATGATQLVADIDPGPDSSDPQDLVSFGGQVYFAANDGTSPLTSQLWTSGGTAGTTTEVASFSPGATASAFSDTNSASHITLGSKLLLPLSDGIRGTSLWATDGTASGTQFLSAVDPSEFALLNGEAFFLGTGGGTAFGLWETNGTPGGTAEVKDLSAYPGAADLYAGGGIAASGGNLYFATQDGSGGVDLWVTNGTAGGTRIVKDFSAPAAGSSYGNSPTVGELTPFAGKLAFVADTGTDGPQVWITDGTSGGTQMLTDIANSSGASGYSTTIDSLTVADGRLYFFASTPDASAGLWSSDGTPGDTSEFFLPNLLTSNPSQPTAVPTPANLTAVGSGLVFSLQYDFQSGPNSVDEYQLWTTIGAGGGAVQIPTAGASSFSGLSNFAVLGSNVIFGAQTTPGGDALWSTDGTAGGTVELKVINPQASAGSYYYGYGQPLVANGILYFSADDGTDGTELWQTDGTTAGTFMSDDINPGPASSSPTPLAVLNGDLILAADDGVHGSELMQLVASSSEAAPQLATIPTQNATVGESFQLDASLYAYDANTPPLPLTYSLGTDAPAGLTIDPSSGLLSWPGASDQTAGTYSFTLTVSDDETPAQVATETLTVDVSPVQSPTIATIATQYVGVGHTFELDVSQYASDPNYPPFPLTYSLTGTPPAGATINANTGILTWATAANQATGPYTFTVKVADNSSPPLVATESFTVQVNTVSPPEIFAIPGQAVNIGTTLSLDMRTYAYDPNQPALPLTFSLGSGAPSGATINPTTGAFTWTPAANQPTGPVSITLIVSDDSTPAKTASQTFTVTVYAAGAALPPVLTSLPTEIVTVGGTLTANLSSYASDPNTPPLPLTFSLGSNAPAGASIDPTTGVLTWAVPSSQPTVPVTFTLIVSDNQTPPESVSGNVTVYVDSLLPPSISTIPAQTVTVGNTVTLALSTYVRDPNSPPLPLTYALGSGAPTGASINPTTGSFTWTPATGVATGTYTIPFTVTDNSTPPLTASGTITVLVGTANEVFPPVLQTLPAEYVTVGETLTANLAGYASDPNTPPLPLTFSLGSNAPAGASIDPTTGVLTWATTSAQPTGPATFTVIVSDNQTPADTASGTITVNVEPVEAPFISTVPAQGVTIGQTLTVDLSQYAHDFNNPPLPLTYALGTNAPSGASIDPSTGVFTWAPGSNVPTQTYTITFIVSNDLATTLSASGTLTVTVGASGQVLAPVLQTLPAEFVTVGETLTSDLASYASDPNTPPLPLTFSLGSNAPAGASINATTGVLTWATTSAQPTGPVTFTVSVSDNQIPPDVVSGSITVNVDAAEPPTIITIPSQSATIGQFFTINLRNYSYDPNSPPFPLTFALGQGAPADANINATSGVFTWTPSVTDGTGTFNIPFTVTDNETPAQSASGTLTIDVAAATVQPPAFRTIPAQTVSQGETLSFNAGSYAYDPNTPPLPLTFSLGNAPPGAINVDATTGVLTWNTASGVPTGTYSIDIVATDNSTPTNSDTAVLTINVVAAQSPTVSMSIPAQAVAAGQPITFNLTPYATDANTPALPLAFSLVTTTLTGATLNPTTGVFQWTPPSNQAAGPVTVTFDVSDSLTSASPTQGTFTIDVSAPAQPPTIRTIPAQSATAGSPFSINLSAFATDPNTPPLTLSYSLGAGAPSGASVNPSSGILTWTPPSNATAGPVTLNFSVTNTADLTATGSFTINVAGAPVLAPTIQTIPAQSATAGSPFSINLSADAKDPNTPPLSLSYSLGANPPAGAVLNPSSGTFTWTPPATQSAGPVTVSFSVTNTANLTTTGSFTIDVAAAQAPTIQPIPTEAATVGKAFQLDLSAYAKDPNSPALALTYTLNGLPPAGAVLNSSSGLFTWTPSASEAAGSVTIGFTVINTANLSASGSFTIDVASAAGALPPVVQPIPAQSATIGQAVSVNVGSYASDPNTPPLPLTFTLAGNYPSGASINSHTGVLTWTPPAGYPTGPAFVTVNVADNQVPPNITVAVITINVSSPPIANPVLTSLTSAAVADVNQSFTLDVSKLASDPNPTPLPLTYSLSGAPAGMTINPTTGLLTWNVPANQRIGNYSATVIVSDNSTPAKTTSETLSFSVVDPSPPPTISSAALSTKKGVSITLTFSQPVDPATASNASNYILTEPAKKSKSKKKPTPPPVAVAASVSYNQATNQVTLKLAKKPPASAVITLTVVGSGPGGIAKLTGLQLAGNGQPGTNYVATIKGKKLSPTAAVSGNTIVVRTARASHALVRHGSDAPAVKPASPAGGPGGPLAVSRAAGARDVFFGTVPTLETHRKTR
jgi:ELWxxDGT repeat protein